MKSTIQKICHSGLLIWLLVVLATFSPLSFQGTVHAQSLKTAAPLGALKGEFVRKVIVVVLSKQWLYAYENGQEVFDTAVITGRPALPTPTGIYHIFAKLSPTTFYSSAPRKSPNWFPPSHIKYALEWRGGGYFLHDSWWHTAYGPGMNLWHEDPQY